jgi:exodeoxyribonuclease VII large subunit
MNTSFTVLTVTQLNFYVKSILESDNNLAHVFLRGEISNFTNHYRSGHFYMSIKDENAVIRAVMFKTNAQKLRFLPYDGMKIIASGRASIFEKDGQYQFYIDDMQPDGIGALYAAFEQLKEKLRLAGLFDENRKKPIPRYPEHIGIVTAPQGAALQDIINILKRRWPIATIFVYPVQVQGVEAPSQIKKGIEYFNKNNLVDVIICGRGGGSLEELWAFNDEELARTIATSDVPIISAVGHETDFTIADFAADLRAPTPSAAAELVSPDIIILFDMISAQRQIMKKQLLQKLDNCKNKYSELINSKAMKSPLTSIEVHRMQLDYLFTRFISSAYTHINSKKQQMLLNIAKLDALSPLKVLSRGYSIVFDENGSTVSSIKQMQEQELLKVKLKDGDLKCRVLSVCEKS